MWSLFAYFTGKQTKNALPSWKKALVKYPLPMYSSCRIRHAPRSYPMTLLRLTCWTRCRHRRNVGPVPRHLDLVQVCQTHRSFPAHAVTMDIIYCDLRVVVYIVTKLDCLTSLNNFIYVVITVIEDCDSWIHIYNIWMVNIYLIS